MGRDEMIPIEDAWGTALIFYIYYADGKKEYYMIPSDKRRKFNERFEFWSVRAPETGSTVPNISTLSELCKKYGRFMTESQFDRLSTQIIGISTRGFEGYRKYAVTGYKRAPK